MTTTETVIPTRDSKGQPFRYYVNLLTNVAHASRRCSGVGRGTAGSSIVRDAEPNATACSKCVPARLRRS